MRSSARWLILLVVVAVGVVGVYSASRTDEPGETAVDAVARSTALSPSDTPTATDTAVPTEAPAPSKSVTATDTPTSMETPATSDTPVPSDTPRPDNSPTPIVVPTATATPADDAESGYDIVTLLPVDAIPAISDPVFLTAEEAEGLYAPEELVLGVEIDGDARAYSIPLLSRHEIVNDEIGGRKIAVTW